MLNRKTCLLLFLGVVLCAVAFEESEAKSEKHEAHSSQKWSPFHPWTGKTFAKLTDKMKAAQEAKQRDFLFRPLKFILRIIAIVTYPPRFVIRFFFTFAATLFLVAFECQVIPEVNCAVPVKDMIPGIVSGLREELEFYASFAKD